MAQVTWVRPALQDLKRIGEYVARSSKANAKKLIARLKEAPKILATTPKLGRLVPEYNLEHLRELVTIHPFRIIYSVRDDTCTILAVIHGSRDLATALPPEELEEREGV